MRKYSFYDWERGDVVLGYDYFIAKGMEPPIVVKFENFSKVERDKIKAVQRELFLDEVNLLVQKFKKVFTARYDASQVKDSFRFEEIKQCEFILKGELPNMDLITLNHWQAVFKYTELLKIQHYYQDYILKGMEMSYNFMHSRESKYKDNSTIPSAIYSQAIWNYLKWIENLEGHFFSTKEVTEGKPLIKFKVDEYALAYIFDLYAKGEQIPMNRIDGGFAAKELKRIGVEKFGLKGDSFYRSVKRIAKYDLNKEQDLVNISVNWLEAVKTISQNWEKVSSYLEKKGLVRDN